MRDSFKPLWVQSNLRAPFEGSVHLHAPMSKNHAQNLQVALATTTRANQLHRGIFLPKREPSIPRSSSLLLQIRNAKCCQRQHERKQEAATLEAHEFATDCAQGEEDKTRAHLRKTSLSLFSLLGKTCYGFSSSLCIPCAQLVSKH